MDCAVATDEDGVHKLRLWGMAVLVSMIGALAPGLAPGQEWPQGSVWVQIEARQTEEDASERAEAYAEVFPDIAGFRLASGWFAIVLGPYPADTALERLRSLREDRMIPADSFIAQGAAFRSQFWPETPAVPAEPPPAPSAAVAPDADPAPAPVPDPPSAPSDLQVAETPEAARAAEAALSQADREALQTALQWFGHYTAAIDGRIGPGSRAAIAAWQTAEGVEPTGVLTSAQRERLVGTHRAAIAELGLTRVTEPEAGIEIDLPLGLVEFDGYDPPFVRYRSRGDSGVQVLLISESGDQTTLFGLYDILQSLKIVPPAGERERGDRSFVIRGRDEQIESYTSVELSGGLIKGFTLVWPVDQGDRIARVLAAMQSSFRPVGDRALDPGLAPLPADQRQGLMTGLDLRRPALSRSGFFIDAEGTVLTTTEVLQNCAQITIEADLRMDLALSDPESGLAVLRPQRALAPAAHATFQQAPERVGAEIAVAGYSFEDALPAPALTFGRIGALEGLSGEPGLKRLELSALPGDAGGPVVDGTGTVVGMLLPQDLSGPRQLPEGVAFAVTAQVIASTLTARGIDVSASAARGALPPEDLTRAARDMTVLVSCWK
jgi:peptidoglycan hydrolase-like protein with peptidoglycan-binding domain